MNSEQQTRVDAYLTQLRRSLRSISPDDVNEIVREIRGHIYDRAEADDMFSDESLTTILKELGRPEDIGALYESEAMISRARASYSPLLILRATLDWAMKSIVGLIAFLFAIFGYGVAFGFLFCAIAKPFNPTKIGLWIDSGTMQLGTSSMPPSHEVLGWWIIPVGLIVGAVGLVLTTLVLRYLLRFAITGRVRAALARIGGSATRLFASSEMHR